MCVNLTRLFLRVFDRALLDSSGRTFIPAVSPQKSPPSHPLRRFIKLALASGLWVSAPVQAQLSVEWVTQYGGTSNTATGPAITVDALGQSWVSGTTGSDLFLSRLSANGNVDFTLQRGGAGNDQGTGVALVGSGLVFVGGHTDSATVDGQASLGVRDGLILRYDVSGNWEETTRFGSNSIDQVFALAGNATHLLAAGMTGGAFDGQSNSGGHDAFLSKRDSNGAAVWTRMLGNAHDVIARGVAFDALGNSYLAGSTPGSFSGFSNAGWNDFFVARYDSAGNQTLLQQFGTDGLDAACDVAADGDGNIYLVGSSGPFNLLMPNFDAVLMKLDSAGSVLWTRSLGGTANDESYALGLDDAGHVWIGGGARSSMGDHINAGGNDAFVAKYDSEGNLVGTIFLATSANEYITGLEIGPDGAAYVAGFTSLTLDGPSGGEFFVAKVVPEPSIPVLFAISALGLMLRRRRVEATAYDPRQRHRG